jgi:hypothetical protein
MKPHSLQQAPLKQLQRAVMAMLAKENRKKYNYEKAHASWSRMIQ